MQQVVRSVVDNYYCLLINFTNSLEPDQARQNVGPDLDQTVWQSDLFPETIIEKKLIKK